MNGRNLALLCLVVCTAGAVENNNGLHQQKQRSTQRLGRKSRTKIPELQLLTNSLDRSCDATSKILSTLSTVLTDLNTIKSSFCGPVVHINQQNIPVVITSPGHYMIDENVTSTAVTITIATSNVDLQLCGNTISSSGGDGVAVLIDANHTNVTVRNGTVSAPFGSGIYVDGNSLLVFDHMTFENGAYGLNLNGDSITDVQISNCFFVGNDDNTIGIGVLATFVGNVTVTRSLFTNSYEGISVIPGDYLTNMLIEDCHFYNLSIGLDIEFSENVIVHNCTVELDNTACAIYDTLNIALSDCQFIDHETAALIISGGSENVMVSNCLLKEAGDGVALINNAQSVTFEQCNMSNQDRNANTIISLVPSNEGGIVSDIVIRECVIINLRGSTNNSFFGVYAQGVSNITIEDCLMEVNSIGDSEGAAIWLDAQVSNVLIKDCHIPNSQHNAFYGIAVVGTGEPLNTNIVVDHCVVENAVDNGIYIVRTEHSTVQNNVVFATGHNGISIDESSDISVLNNKSQANSNHGIFLFLNTSGCVVRDNVVSSNGGNGIRNDAGTCNAFSRNFSYNNTENSPSGYFGVSNVQAVGSTPYGADANTYEAIACD
jgi:parallel beta-helix repeat protein